jgi:hypothetical protein
VPSPPIVPPLHHPVLTRSSSQKKGSSKSFPMCPSGPPSSRLRAPFVSKRFHVAIDIFPRSERGFCLFDFCLFGVFLVHSLLILFGVKLIPT